MKSHPKSILLIISGGIAAYKIPELIRSLTKKNISVTCLMTKAAGQFVTPLTLGSLSGNPVYTELFDLKDETEIGHIQLSRQADLIVVAPATANIIAKMAHGITDDLATTCLLATNKPIIIAPAMNVKMWQHPATQRNLAQLIQDGVSICGPEDGAMACGETGMGRMSELTTLHDTICAQLASRPAKKLPLTGKHVLITAGPTLEKIDPVRYIANHSSGKQGYALARQAARLGAEVTLISGPTQLNTPAGVKTIQVTTAQQMLDATLKALPADIAICAAAVADWRVTNPASEKMKKTSSDDLPQLSFTQNPDILYRLSHLQQQRPKLIIGFAAETENIITNAKLKLVRKGCDIIIANDVSEHTQTFGGDSNQIHFITPNTVQSWDNMSKTEVSKCILEEIIKTTA